METNNVAVEFDDAKVEELRLDAGDDSRINGTGSFLPAVDTDVVQSMASGGGDWQNLAIDGLGWMNLTGLQICGSGLSKIRHLSLNPG